MNTKDNHQDPKPLVEGNDASSELKAQSESRRRLLKKAGLVAVPVVTTLASRPVLAWHCRTPSMWGSMAMNPATSLMKHRDHEVSDSVSECWYIGNWANNSQRSDRTSLGKPWNKLFAGGFPSVAVTKDKKTTNGKWIALYVNKTTKYICTSDYSVSAFCADAGIQCPPNAGTVADLFGAGASGFAAHIVVAQLHEKLLPAVKECFVDSINNNKQVVLNLREAAANGGYVTVNGLKWTPEMFVDYFEANWIAVAGTSSGWYQDYMADNDPNEVNGNIKQYIKSDGDGKVQDRHYFNFN